MSTKNNSRKNRGRAGVGPRRTVSDFFSFFLELQEGTGVHNRVEKLLKSLPASQRQHLNIGNVLCLLTARDTLDYRLYVNIGGECVPGLDLQFFAHWVRNYSSTPLFKLHWHSCGRIKTGLFFAVDGQGLPTPLEVIDNQALCYLDADGHPVDLGRSTSVRRSGLGLNIPAGQFERVRRLILRVSLEKTAPTRENVAIPEAPVLSIPSHEVSILRWDVLPMGWWKQLTSQGERFAPSRHKEEHAEAIERLSFLETLRPETWYSGSHLGQRIYHVALFDSIAVAECPEWGNALYFCSRDGEQWRSVFRLTKAEALRAGARRMPHSENWRNRLKSIVT